MVSLSVSKTDDGRPNRSTPATCCFANNPVDGFDASRVTTARGFTPMLSKRTTTQEGDILRGHSLMVEYLLCTQKIGIRFPVAPLEVIQMIGNYKVITLCGSTRFKDDFERVNRELTLLGNIVISVGAFGHAGDTFTEEQKVMLDDIHKRKIDMADEIFVINKDKYIGASTRSEIEYAILHDKPVRYME